MWVKFIRISDILQSLDFTTKINPGESLHRGQYSRAIPASQGYKDSNLEMTESESVALPFGDSPMRLLEILYMKYILFAIPNSKKFSFCKNMI